MNKAGILYLIPSGISEGPLPYLPEHTLECIRSLDIFICERAKTARRFIKQINHPKPISELVFVEIPKKREYIYLDEDLAPLSKGQNIGLLSEAGSPGIADPGAEICLRAHQMKAEIVPLIGPSSILLALMASGLNGQQFTFHGYLSPKKELIGRDLKRLEHQSCKDKGAHIFIETPYRNGQILDAMKNHLSNSTLFCIAAGIHSPEAFIRTMSVADWKKERIPNIHKVPAVFILQVI